MTPAEAAIEQHQLAAILGPLVGIGALLWVRCGNRDCGRRLALVGEPTRGPWGLSWGGSAMRTREGNPMPDTKASMPAIRRLDASPALDDEYARYEYLHKITCHPRCGRDYTFTELRAATAYAAAVAEGRSELIAGVDL
jgi:hypothetical protein